jgi:hypothetical protein
MSFERPDMDTSPVLVTINQLQIYIWICLKA